MLHLKSIPNGIVASSKKVSENYLKNWDTFSIFKNMIFVFKYRGVERMLAMKHRKAVTSAVQNRYVKAIKKAKTMILDEFCTTTGYNRVYAARILRLKVGKVIGYARMGGKKIKYVIGKKKKTKKKRDKIYTYDVF